MASKILKLEEEQAELIRDMLLIGLQCYGEIEEVRDHASNMESVGKPLNPEAVPCHPTGTNDVVSRFADALRVLFSGLSEQRA